MKRYPHSITVRLDAATAMALETLAEEHGATLSDQARQLIVAAIRGHFRAQRVTPQTELLIRECYRTRHVVLGVLASLADQTKAPADTVQALALRARNDAELDAERIIDELNATLARNARANGLKPRL